MVEFVKFPEREYQIMKANITMEYANTYGISLNDAIDLFVDKGVYDLLDEERDLYMTRMYPYMVDFIHDWIYRTGSFAYC